MTTTFRFLPPVDATVKNTLFSRTMSASDGSLSPLLELDTPVNAGTNRGPGAAKDGRTPVSNSFPKALQDVKAPQTNSDVNNAPRQHSLSTYSPVLDRRELSEAVITSSSNDPLHMPVLSSTEEKRTSASAQNTGSPRRLGGFFRSHSKENGRRVDSASSRRPAQLSTRKGSTSERSGSGQQESQELGTLSFSAVQTSTSRQPSLGRPQQGGGSDPFLASVSSPILTTGGANPPGSRHGRVRTGSDVGQMPMVSVDINAMNTSSTEDPLNTSRSLRGARAVLRRKQLGSFRLGASRTAGPLMGSSLARRSSLNNRTISFVGAEDDTELYSPTGSEGLGTPICSPRQRTRVPGAGCSSTASTVRLANGALAALDHANSIPLMERVNTDTAFFTHVDDDSGSAPRRSDRVRKGLSISHASKSNTNGSVDAELSHSDDEADADLHDQKVRNLIQHLSRSGMTSTTRTSPSTNVADVPNVFPQEDTTNGGSLSGPLNDARTPLNDSDSNTFPVFGGGWSGLGGGDLSAVTSNDWYARMRMKVTEESDDEDSVLHPNHTPLPAEGHGAAAKPNPPALGNTSPSPKAKLDHDHDQFIQPPTPSAHGGKQFTSDRRRSTITGSSSVTSPLGAPTDGKAFAQVMAPSSVLMMNNPAASRRGSTTTQQSRSPLTNNDSQRHAVQPEPLSGSGRGSGEQQRLSVLSSPTYATATRGVMALPAAATAPAPRVVYRRSSRSTRPSDSMPQLSAAAAEAALSVPQQMTPMYDYRATAKGPATAGRKPAGELTRPKVYVRPVSGAPLASARSPFKGSVTSSGETKATQPTTPMKRTSQTTTTTNGEAATSAPAAKSLRHPVPSTDNSPTCDSAKSTPGGAAKPSAYMAVRRQSTTAPATTTSVTSVHPQVKPNTILGETRTPKAPTTRRTTVHRRGSQGFVITDQPSAAVRSTGGN